MRVTSADFLDHYGELAERALSEPVTITREGRDRLVLVSAAEFERLRRYAPRSRAVEDLTEDEVAMIAKSSVPAEHDHLNSLLDG